MTSANKVLFILGGGPRIGQSVALKFVEGGYKVALGRRTLEPAGNPEHNSVLTVQVDVTKADSVEKSFKEVETKLGTPNVVVYNAACLTFPDDGGDPFAISPEKFEHDTAINVLGGYAALHHATRGFAKLRESSSDAPRVFIATGNVTPFKPIPFAMTLSSGKAALANLIQIAAQTYQPHGEGFYFISQVLSNGGTVPYDQVEAGAHGDVYWDTVTSSKYDGRWDVRFSVDEDGKIVDHK